MRPALHAPPRPAGARPAGARPAGARPAGARLARVLVLCLALLLLVADPAAAHTRLDASDPPDGAELDAPLAEVELTFSKPIELLPRGMRVADARGQRAPTTVAQARSADGMVVVVTFDPPLGAGAWTLRWKVLASDSHPRQGELAFEVEDLANDRSSTPAPEVAPRSAATPAPGSPAPATSAAPAPATPAAPAADDEPDPRLLERLGDLARVVFYLGLMAAIGLASFLVGPHRGERSGVGRLAFGMFVGSVLGLVGSTAEVVLHVTALSGLGLGGALDGPTWSAVLRTGLGAALLLRTTGLVLLLVASLWRLRARRRNRPMVVALLGSALVVGSMQFVGHTASTAPEWAIRSSDVVHVVAACVWVGGLLGLALLSIRHGDRAGRARTAARFADAAAVAVAAVAVAGSVMAWLNLPSVEALFTTTYGRLLIAKLALVGVLGALGAHNHFRVVPRLVDGDTEAVVALRRTVTAEVAVVLVVIALTAVLIDQVPV